MDYEAVRATFFQPCPEVAVPDVMRHARGARLLRDAIEALGMHAVWSPTVNRVLAAHGMDFFSCYVWGRAASLGDASGAVVTATFAAFEPGRLIPAYEAGRAAVPRDRLLADLDASVGESLAGILAGDDVSGAAATLRRAVDAADGTGKPLFSGVRALGWPDDPYTALWRGCLALREFRGDTHVAVYVAAGFDPVRMNILTELWAGYPLGAYSGSRAWSAEHTAGALDQLRADGLLDGDDITERGRGVRDELEAATDRVCEPLVDAIGPSYTDVVADLHRWGQVCIEAGAFPPDPRKLACG